MAMKRIINDKNYMIIYPNFTKFTQIFFSSLNSTECCVEGGYRYTNVFFKNGVRALSVLQIPSVFGVRYGKWIDMKNYTGTIILFDQLADQYVLKKISKRNPRARKILYLWNPHIQEETLKTAIMGGVGNILF